MKEDINALRNCCIITVIGFMVIIFRLAYWSGEDSDRIKKLEAFKKSTEPIISRLHDECSGHTDEINELRTITDEFRAQIKGLQKEVFVGVQKEAGL